MGQDRGSGLMLGARASSSCRIIPTGRNADRSVAGSDGSLTSCGRGPLLRARSPLAKETAQRALGARVGMALALMTRSYSERD
jgi:hypothetical protein